MRAEEYLHILTDQMRCKMARDAVKEELRWHIEDQKAAYMSEGMESAEAEEAAVQEMGDPVETGQEMDRIHRPKMPWGPITLIAVLSVVGIAAQQLVQAKVVEAGGDSWISPRWPIYLIVSVLVMTGICCSGQSCAVDAARPVADDKLSQRIHDSPSFLCLCGCTGYSSMEKMVPGFKKAHSGGYGSGSCHSAGSRLSVLLAASVLAGLMLVLFIWFIRGALGQKNQLGMLMGTGCSAVFLLQALFYVANNLGVVRPMVSYCPFFTYGGSGMIVSYAMMGIILSIFRYKNTAPERKTSRRLFRPN